MGLSLHKKANREQSNRQTVKHKGKRQAAKQTHKSIDVPPESKPAK